MEREGNKDLIPYAFPFHELDTKFVNIEISFALKGGILARV